LFSRYYAARGADTIDGFSNQIVNLAVCHKLTHAFQIAIRRNCDKQFVFDALVDFKLRVSFQIFPDGSFRVIPRSPGTVREEICRYVLDDGIENYAVTADGSQWSIGHKLSQNMLVGVVGIKADEHLFLATGLLLNLCNDVGGNAGAFEHGYAAVHRVFFNGLAVVGTDFDVDAQHLGIFRTSAGGVQLQHGCEED